MKEEYPLYGKTFSICQSYGENHLMFDEEKGRFIITYGNKNSNDCFLMPIEAWYGLTEELFQMFGASYWLILQKAGEGAGRISARSFQDLDSEKIVEAIKIGFNGISRWGFGRYKLKELDIQNKHVVFELYDSIFDSTTNNEYKRFVEEQHFLVGFYKGLFSALLGKMMRCTRSRITDNAKSYYRFELNPEFEEYNDTHKHSRDKDLSSQSLIKHAKG
jgi:hypothetical protein